MIESSYQKEHCIEHKKKKYKLQIVKMMCTKVHRTRVLI